LFLFCLCGWFYVGFVPSYGVNGAPIVELNLILLPCFADSAQHYVTPDLLKMEAQNSTIQTVKNHRGCMSCYSKKILLIQFSQILSK